MKLVNSALIEKIAQNTRQETDEVKKTLDAMTFAIADTLQDIGSKVIIKNIGTFELKERKARNIILNNRLIETEDGVFVKFTPSKKLKDIYAIYEER